MKKYFTFTILAIIIVTTIMASRPETSKFGPFLKWTLDNKINSNSNYIVYIYLKDKGPDASNRLSNPLSLVTQRSLDRRAKVLPAGQLVEMCDVPIYSEYFNDLSSYGITIRQQLKWFNAVSAEVTKDQLYLLAEKEYVDNIELVETFYKRNDNVELKESSNDDIPITSPQVDSLSYGTGSALTQITQIKVNLVHDIGDFGQGVMIASFDNGFRGQNHQVFTTLPTNVFRQYDFQLHINNAYSVGTSSSHGTNTMSLVGAYKPGTLVGPAFKSIFIVARTEVDTFERPIEMDNWSAAAQWADSLGADVITSSLGYLAFDSPYPGYTYLDMNGHTLVVTKAAALAAHHGIVVCNSAGNNGNGGTINTLNGPADADSIITVGAVTSSGTIASFSSQGPTTDTPPRIKPDVDAMGSNNYVATPDGTNTYENGSGTSFSCPLTAGVCALVLAANKNLTPLQVRGILRKFANNYANPNNTYGWGIIDAQQSVDSARKLDVTAPTIVHTQPFTSTTNTGVLTFKARVFDNGIIRYTRSGEAPRIYFRKTTNNGINWTAYTSANFTAVTLDTFSFQITGSTLGTKVEYYLAAQDIALPNPLAATLPAGGSGINPPGSTAPPTRFTFTVGATSVTSNSTNIPDEYKLFDNYPNPFNPETNIRFLIKDAGIVTLKVYDITGKLVSTLVNEKLSAGDYTTKLNGTNIASGIYFYRIESNGFTDVKKMMLIK